MSSTNKPLSYEDMQKIGTAYDMPEGATYTPPNGIPILLNLPPDAKIYEVEDPTKQTDLLVRYERRHTLPIAMMVAGSFGTVPVPDDVYRMAPEHSKNNLFCIISRSGIVKSGGLLHWDAVVVTVQKLCIVRVECTLNPALDEFHIDRLLLWSSKGETYHPVSDPAGVPINPEVLPTILDQYARVEGIIK